MLVLKLSVVTCVSLIKSKTTPVFSDTLGNIAGGWLVLLKVLKVSECLGSTRKSVTVVGHPLVRCPDKIPETLLNSKFR